VYLPIRSIKAFFNSSTKEPSSYSSVPTLYCFKSLPSEKILGILSSLKNLDLYLRIFLSKFNRIGSLIISGDL